MLTVRELANQINAQQAHINREIKNNNLPVEFTTVQTIRGPRTAKVLPPETERFLRERFQTMTHYKASSKKEPDHGYRSPMAVQFLSDLIRVSETAIIPVDVGRFINQYRKLVHDGVR